MWPAPTQAKHNTASRTCGRTDASPTSKLAIFRTYALIGRPAQQTRASQPNSALFFSFFFEVSTQVPPLLGLAEVYYEGAVQLYVETTIDVIHGVR